MVNRAQLTCSGCWVVKVGTSLLTDKKSGLNQSMIVSLAQQITELKERGVQVVLVSSGSIGEGIRRLGWSVRPRELHELQTAAAVGQMTLVQRYEAAFNQFDVLTAQILLTHADLANRQRYLNAKRTLRELLKLGVVPIVNENDSVANEEIRFGDNDTLAALTANLVEADALIILTDQSGLYDQDPKYNPDAKLIHDGMANDSTLMDKAGEASNLGRGGMITKLTAAHKAARSGATTVIAAGAEPDVLLKIREGQQIGTFLSPGNERMAARKQWLAGQLRGSGKLTLDSGAVEVLRNGGRSLLAIGITAVEGSFICGEIVQCVDRQGNEVALGIVNYSSTEVKKIYGKASTEIKEILGYSGESEVIHRDNIAISS